MGIVRRIVPMNFRLEFCALGQRHVILEVIAVLPGEVPVLDQEQGFHFAAWQGRRHLQLRREVMRVCAHAHCVNSLR